MDTSIIFNSTQCLCSTSPAPVTDNVTGEIACSRCGAVLVSRAERPHVTDNHTLLDNNVSSTKIQGDYRMRRASQIANRVDHSGVAAIRVTKACCAKLGLPSTMRERAIVLFNKFRAELRGRNVSVMSAAVLYMACREHSITRSMAEICRVMDADLKATRRAYANLHKSHEIPLPIPTPAGFATRLASDLGLPEKTARKALNILKRLNDSGQTAGRHPGMLAAYAVYVAANDDGIDMNPANVAKMSEVTPEGLRGLIKILKTAQFVAS